MSSNQAAGLACLKGSDRVDQMEHQSLHTPPRRILIIDDYSGIHQDFRKTLDPQTPSAIDAAEEALFGATPLCPPKVRFELASASQGQEGLAMLQEAMRDAKPFQLAFVDMRMPPGWDGVQTIAKLWEVDPDLQVVICTAYSDYSWSEIIDKLGISDRLLILKKPFDAAEVCQLATTLTEKWIITRQARLKLSELEELVEQRTASLRTAALHDNLTGLPNRALCLERLGRMIAIHQRQTHRHYAVMFMDFDGFKLVNDSLGHDAGDLLLQAISARLTHALRDHDTVVRMTDHTAARLGGDEFIVLLDGLTQPADAQIVAQRLLNRISDAYEIKGRTIRISASVGVTTSEFGYTCADDVLRDADTAMYHAKASGKGQFACFTPGMHDEAVNRMNLQLDLLHAIENHQLQLVFQPIVSLADGQPISFEVLTRWNHPQRGWIAPLEFIKVAEESNLIHTLSSWVLNESLKQWASAVQRYPKLANLSLSVNISRRELTSPHLIDHIRQALASSGIPAHLLRLEITESAIIGDLDQAIDTLTRIRALGIALDIDDFGTGYSSLSCLHKFPISGLKIDRSFVGAITERSDYAAVIQAIVSLARNLKIELIAEGIETANQAAMLHSMGVDYAQGYYFAKPLELWDALASLGSQPLLEAA